jgi:hypothetical protein
MNPAAANANRDETSVTFSLAELRRIEETRVATERAERAQRLHDAEQLQADAQRRRDDAERAAVERARSIELEHVRALESERLRTELAERQAHIDAEARVAAQRLALEAEQARVERLRLTPAAPARWPWLVATIVAMAMTAAGAWAMHDAGDATRAQGRELAALEERLDGADGVITALRGEIDGLRKDLAARPVATPVAAPPAPPQPTPPTARPRPPRPQPQPPHSPPPVTIKCRDQPLGCR